MQVGYFKGEGLGHSRYEDHFDLLWLFLRIWWVSFICKKLRNRTFWYTLCGSQFFEFSFLLLLMAILRLQVYSAQFKSCTYTFYHVRNLSCMHWCQSLHFMNSLWKNAKWWVSGFPHNLYNCKKNVPLCY